LSLSRNTFIPSQVEKGRKGAKRISSPILSFSLFPVILSIILILSCSLVGLRGCSGDVIILEEAAYIDPKLFQNVVVPLMLMQHTVVLAISSPSDENNYASTLSEVTLPNGEHIFLGEHVNTVMCDECKEAGLVKCPHIRTRRPMHQGVGNLAIAEAMISNEQDRQQELHGVIGGEQHMFAKYVGPLFKKPRHCIDGEVTLIHTFIDPSANGKGSDYAIVSATHRDGKTIVVGLDEYESVKNNGDAFFGSVDYIRKHIQKLFDVHKEAKVWLYIEANLNGPVCAYVGREVQRFFTPGRIILQQHKAAGGEMNIGVMTTNQDKEVWAHNLTHILHDESLLFASTMIGQDLPRSMLKVREQLNVYARVNKEQKDAVFGIIKWVYSGKMGGRLDDMAICLQAVAYWIYLQRCNPNWTEMCAQLHVKD
jgi:hypothetical protein